MDPVDFLVILAARDWRFTPAGLAEALRPLGYPAPRAVDDRYVFAHPERPLVARAGVPAGTIESVAWSFAATPDPEALDEREWDEAIANLERRFLADCRRAVAVLGSPAQFGRTRGASWCSWDTRHALWVRSNAWLMLQQRQDDTDLPAELCVVWTAPGRFPAALGGATIPDDPTSIPPAAPRSLQETLVARCHEAHALRGQRRFAEAQALYQSVVDSAPFFAAAWFDYGACLAEAGDAGNAFACLERALAEDGDFLGRVTLKRVEILRATGGARANYERLTARMQQPPADARACYELALMLQQQGHPAPSRQLLEQFVRIAPDDYAHDRERMATWLRS